MNVSIHNMLVILSTYGYASIYFPTVFTKNKFKHVQTYSTGE